MSHSILYLYLNSSPLIPLQTENRKALRNLNSQIPIHDLDLDSDGVIWEYSQQWLEQQETVLLLLDASILEEGQELTQDFPLKLKKTLGKLLRYRKKLKVIYLDSFVEHPFHAQCKALNRLPQEVIREIAEIEQLDFS